MGTSTHDVSAAEQARQDVRRKRMLRSQALDTLPPPGVNKKFVADLDDMTILGDALRAGQDRPAEFRLEVPEWEFSDASEDDELKVYADDSPEPFFTQFYSPTTKPTFPLEIQIPQERLDAMGEGERTFKYTITSYNDNVARSEELTLIFDRVSPYQNAVPPKFADIPYVTDDNIEQVKLVLTDYAGRKPGDTVHVWWLKELSYPLPGPNFAMLVEDALKQQLHVPPGLIEDAGDGGVRVVYSVGDKARNFSSASDILHVGVALGPWPTAFELPVVDLAPIDQADVAQGVEVQVPAFDNAKDSDEVRVHWGSKATAWRAVAALAELELPMLFKIQPLWIWEEYGAGAGTGDVDVEVTYEVRRGTVALLEKGVKAITVAVNLERIGPVDPDPDPEWPGPINGKLAPAKVYGAVSNTENTLDDRDANQDVKVVVLVDGAFEESDVVTLYWRGEQVPGVEHKIQAAEPGTEIEMWIPWPVIAAVGNGDIPMHYAIHRPGNPNGTQPESTEVAVSGLVTRTAAPAFDGVSPSGFLNCQSIWSDPRDPADPAFRVVVPDLGDVGFKVGEKVQMIWRATVFDTDAPIDAVGLAQDIELDADNIGGFVWRIPYETNVLPIYQYDGTHTDGNGYVSYKSLAGGTPIESDEATARVSIHSAGNTCDISKP